MRQPAFARLRIEEVERCELLGALDARLRCPGSRPLVEVRPEQARNLSQPVTSSGVDEASEEPCARCRLDLEQAVTEISTERREQQSTLRRPDQGIAVEEEVDPDQVNQPR